MAPPSGVRPPLPRATISVNAPAAALTPLKSPRDVEAGRVATRAPGAKAVPPLSPKMKAAVWVAAVLLVASVGTLVAVLATQVTNQSSSSGSGTPTPSPPPVKAPRSPPAKAPSTGAPTTAAPVRSPQSAAPAQQPAASSPPALPPPPPPAPPVEVPDGFDVVLLSDEFDGSALDTTKWAFDPDTDQQTSEGLQTYSMNNVNVVNSSLVITALKAGTSYTSGRIRSVDSWYPGMKLPNGKAISRLLVQGRIKVPKEGKGLWSAFWMAPKNETKYGKWPASGEIDIMECIDDSVVVQGLHYGAPWPGNEKSTVETGLKEGETYSDSFHQFGLDWEKNNIRVNANYKRQEEFNSWWTSMDGADWPAPFDQPFSLVLNLAVGGDFPGPPDATTPFPASLEADYIRVFAKLA